MCPKELLKEHRIMCTECRAQFPVLDELGNEREKCIFCGHEIRGE